jgi:tRNA modification GTPase
MEQNNTIVAVATPSGIGALAVIRISGPDSFFVISKCISSVNKFLSAAPKQVLLQLIKDSESEEIIDEITLVKYQEPKSFTGENMVEIICHGGPYIVQKIIKILIKNGAIGANKGEFTQRAFLNGKLDLMKAEAINSMIECTTEIENKLARQSYMGRYIEILKRWQKQIQNILIQIESEIEFGEEDDIKDSTLSVNEIVNIEKEINLELFRKSQIKDYDEGIRVVIAGPVNAGKSTLFNFLLGYNRSITNEEPGTTRDTVSEKIVIVDKEILLIDSAGFRITNNSIESQGIKRTISEINKAHLIIWVTSADCKFEDDEILQIQNINSEEIVFLVNKMDLPINQEKFDIINRTSKKAIYVSLEKNINTINIITQIEHVINDMFKKFEAPDIINSIRQEQIAIKMHSYLQLCISDWQSKEIAAFHLNKALHCIEEFTGKRDNEEMYNTIFEKFCIGK